MKVTNTKRVIAAILAITCLASSLTGCANRFSSVGVEGYPLVNMASKGELKEYYAKSLDYDSVISRNYEVHAPKYELKELNPEELAKIQELVASTESILGEQNYEVDEETAKLITKDMYEYIKGSIDSLVLSNGRMVNSGKALGYYFVDMEYDVSAQQPGTFAENIDMLGVQGAWRNNPIKNEDTYFSDYLKAIEDKLNAYFKTEHLPYKCEYNKDIHYIQIYHAAVEDDDSLHITDIGANLTDYSDKENDVIGSTMIYDKDGNPVNQKKYLVTAKAPRVNAVTPSDEYEKIKKQKAKQEAEDAKEQAEKEKENNSQTSEPNQSEYNTPESNNSSELVTTTETPENTESVEGVEGTESVESTENTETQADNTSSEAQGENAEEGVLNGTLSSLYAENEETTEEVSITRGGRELDEKEKYSGYSKEEYEELKQELIKEIEGYFDPNSMVPVERKVLLDLEYINSLMGAAYGYDTYLPDLDAFYEKPAAAGTISGFGIYPEGANGLKAFSFDRANVQGTATLRYIFKEDSKGSGEIIGSNIYLYSLDMSNSFNNADENIILAEFLKSNLEQVIERADRVQANADISGMLNGKIYEDKGYAVLRAYKKNFSHQLKYMSTIRQVLGRSTANNAYLLEVETTTIDGATSSGAYGTFRDRYYVVVQQQGTEFVISDSMRISRITESEPLINPDSALIKRLTALNLSGDVTDEAKPEIIELMSALYTAGTNRVTTGPATVNNNGQEVQIDRGLYDCFNNDKEMLNSEKLEEMNSKLREPLIKYGAGVSSVYVGTITEWIGGYKNQAEFTTEELVTYAGRDDGHYMQVYYLVSKMGDNWVIDERTILDEYKVEGGELATVKSRLGLS